MNTKNASSLQFPSEVLTGSLGDLAHELSRGNEVSGEFIFAAGITCVGALASGQLTLDIGLESDTRLYTILHGASGITKKSTAANRVIDFFTRDVTSPFKFHRENGVGSAEGLVKRLQTDKNLLLNPDELQTVMSKMGIQNSVLLPLLAQLFEKQDYDASTKSENFTVRDARLSILTCCTPETYEKIWTPSAIAIGLPNRLFLVHADGKPPVAWPKEPDAATLRAIRTRLQHQLTRLPLKLSATDEAKELWADWDARTKKEGGEYIKRLDTIGRRIMAILALTNDKNEIDAEVMEQTCAILDYQHRARRLFDPIDAENVVAKLEEKIRRVVKDTGTISKRELRRRTNADRMGLWAFDAALKNVKVAGDIVESAVGIYAHPEAVGNVSSQVSSPSESGLNL